MNMMSAGQDLASRDDASREATNGYMRIGDVAKEFDVTLRTLRFYEDKGLIKPLRDGSTRLYSRRDLARLRLVLLGRKVGFSLREVKQIMDLYEPEGSNTRQLRLVAEKSERQLARLQKQRQEIDEAIEELRNLAADARERLQQSRAA